MYSKFENLEKLSELYTKGVITQEEYEAEKKKILDSDREKEEPQVSSFEDNGTYSAIMHLARYINYGIPLGGMIVVIVMWLARRDRNRSVDQNGKVILNWLLSKFIYLALLAVITLVFLLSTFGTALFSDGYFDDPLEVLGIFRLLVILLILIAPIIVLLILDFVSPIIGAVKAANREVWNYPLSIRFFKTKD